MRCNFHKFLSYQISFTFPQGPPCIATALTIFLAPCATGLRVPHYRALTLHNTTNFCSLSHNPSGTLPCGTTRTFLSGLHCLSTVPTPFATDQGQGIDTPQQQICLEQVTDLPQGDKVSAAVRKKILRDFLPWQLPQTIPDPVVSPKAWRTRAEKLCAAGLPSRLLRYVM